MQIAIVIVSWNVKDLLRRCLASIFEHANEDIEICVVDNASADGSAEMVRTEFSNVHVIDNMENRGFAVACNQGWKATSGEYVFFLNPDTVVTADAIAELKNFLQLHPSSAIAAPQLLAHDGKVQPSVRKFPGPWDALRYFFTRRSPREEAYGDERQIEQPMGAAFMMRRSLLDQIGGFDEAFFLWFDEVDLCRRVRLRGYEIWYVPMARIVHVGGQSFRQRSTLEKQAIYFSSYTHYLWKHFQIRALVPATLMHGYSALMRALAWFVSSAKAHPLPWITGGAILLVELCSLFGYFFPVIRTGGFIVVLLAALVLSIKDLRYGVWIMVAELIIGSKGHELGIVIAGMPIGVRIGVFASVLVGWVVSLIRRRALPRLLYSAYTMYLAVLAIFFIAGLVMGFVLDNGVKNILLDANAWLFFLFAGVLADALSTRKDFRAVVVVAMTALGIQTAKILLTLYIMSHKAFGFPILYSWYRWIRTSGVGEVTQLDYAYRIFFQSQIYALLFIFFALCVFQWLLERHALSIRAALRRVRPFDVFFVCVLASFLLSFSRSFWVAAFLTSITWVALSLCQRHPVRAVGKTVLVACIAGIIAIFTITLITVFPLPPTSNGFGIDAFAKRFEDLDTEAAAASRWSLLPVLLSEIRQNPFGYGFGKTVTYTSYDPRIREKNGTGTFTTYAFEWGFLDVAMKMGIGGLLALLALLWQILLRAYFRLKEIGNHDTAYPVVFGCLLSVIALSATHILTPYLNHPLGIGVLLTMALYVEKEWS